MRMTGTLPSLPCRRRNTSSPDRSGRRTSSTTASGFCFSNSRNPSAAEPAVRTETWPAGKRTRKQSRVRASSSMTRTDGIVWDLGGLMVTESGRLKDAAEGGEQLLVGVGLVQERVGADAGGLAGPLAERQAAAGDDAQCRVAQAQGGERLRAVRARHHHVQKHGGDLPLMAAMNRQGLVAVAGRQHAVAVPLQGRPDRFPD